MALWIARNQTASLGDVRTVRYLSTNGTQFTSAKLPPRLPLCVSCRRASGVKPQKEPEISMLEIYPRLKQILLAAHP